MERGLGVSTRGPLTSSLEGLNMANADPKARSPVAERVLTVQQLSCEHNQLA
jgi:hypothetical protein